jgi:hypothetical protein
MSYDSIETSEYSSQQTYLYLITLVDTVYYLTNSQSDITATIDGSSRTFTYPRGGISHSEFAESQDSGRTGTTLAVSIGNPLVRRHREYPPHGDTTLVIYRQNELAGTPYAIWSGTLFSPKIEGVEASFECLTDFELMARAEGLNDTYQALCNWFFGHHPCPVNMANWRQAVSVVSIDRDNFAVTVSGSASVADWFKPGLLEAPNGDKRSILADSVSGGNHTFTLQQNFPSTTLLVGSSANAYPVCDRSYTQGSVKYGGETGSGAGCGTNQIQTNVNPHEIGRLQ